MAEIEDNSDEEVLNEIPLEVTIECDDNDGVQIQTEIGQDPLEIHNTEDRECKICGKTFPSVHLLQSHVKIIHDKMRRHGCPFCEKDFGKKISQSNYLHQTWSA